MSFTAPAVRSKGISIGKPNNEEKGRLLGAIDHLFEIQRAGKRNLLFIAEKIQRLADGEYSAENFEFGAYDRGHSLAGIPKHLLFGGEKYFRDIVIHDTDGNESSKNAGEKHRLSDLIWRAPDGYSCTVDALPTLCSFDFSKVHIQTIGNVHNGHRFSECAYMIGRSNARALGAKSFFACLVLMDKWPIFWRDCFDLMKGGRGTHVIIFVGNEVSVRGTNEKFYLGFRMISHEGKMDALCVPALYPVEDELGIGYERFYFAVQQ